MAGGKAPGEASSRDAEPLGHAELRDVIDAVDEAVVIFDDAGNVVSMNPAGRRLHACATGSARCPTRSTWPATTAERAEGGCGPDGTSARSRGRSAARRSTTIELHVRDAGDRPPLGRHLLRRPARLRGGADAGHRDDPRRHRAEARLRGAARGRPAQGRVPRDALARAAEPARANPQRGLPSRARRSRLRRRAPRPRGDRAPGRAPGRGWWTTSSTSPGSRAAIELRRERLDLAELVPADRRGPPAAARGRRRRARRRRPGRAGPSTATRPGSRSSLGNLLQNAAKFTPARRPRDPPLAARARRAVGARPRHRRGIDPALLGRVFEPFVQEERTLARSRRRARPRAAAREGARGAARRDASRRRAPGRARGAEFMVRLPLARARRRAPAPSAGAAASDGAPRGGCSSSTTTSTPPSRSRRVAFLGHAVEAVTTGRRARPRARAPPDVVLCDIGLPGMDGYEVARAIRADPDLARRPARGGERVRAARGPRARGGGRVRRARGEARRPGRDRPAARVRSGPTRKRS